VKHARFTFVCFQVQPVYKHMQYFHCSESYKRRSVSSPRTRRAAQITHVAPGYGEQKLTSSCSTMDWILNEDFQKTEDGRSSSWMQRRFNLPW